jgi:CBS domain-containing protein
MKFQRAQASGADLAQSLAFGANSAPIGPASARASDSLRLDADAPIRWVRWHVPCTMPAAESSSLGDGNPWRPIFRSILMNVREVMSTEPFVAGVTASIRQVMRILNEADIRHIPVVEGDRLVGIVSDRDLRHLMPPALESFDNSEQLERLWSQPISTLMSSDVLTIDPNEDIVEAIDLMIEHKIGALPVAERGSAELLGIVSYVDVLREARRVL